MKKHFAFPIIICGYLFSGCSAPQLRVQSDPPNAQVFVSQQGSKDKVQVGITPFDIPFKEVTDKVGEANSGEYYIMTIEGKDLQTERVLLPTTSFGSKVVSIKVQLSKKEESRNANEILLRLHSAQKFAQTRQFERAQIELDKALDIDSQFVRAITMKASLYYLQKNPTEALKWFEKAVAIDSSFEEAINMIAKLKAEKK